MKSLMRLVCLTLILSGSACSGGGSIGSESEVGTDQLTDKGTNVCSLIGLKVLNGRKCSGLQRSPIVRIISDYSSGRTGYCSGTMITPTKVLTAGHCGRNINVPSDKRLSSKVVTGLSGDSQFVNVVSFVVHPQFRVDGVRYINDMAIATLSHPVNLPTLPVLKSIVPSVGDTVNVAGFGRTVTGTPPNLSFETLLHQPLNLRTGQMVLSKVTSVLYQAENVAGMTSLCHGDSGSPLLLVVNGKPLIIGVTSLVQANNQPVHCAPGTSSTWTRLQAPSVLNELIKEAPDVDLR